MNRAAPHRTLRDLPRYQIVARMRQRAVTQETIARRARCSRSYVTHVLSRRNAGTRLTERVWVTLERALGRNGGA